MNHKTSSRYFASLLLVAGAFAAAGTLAASHCKGLDADGCAAATGCLWVDGYTRKDGRQVSAHCKLKGGKAAQAAADDSGLQLSSQR